MFMAVDLPEPEGPMIATNSPIPMRRSDGVQRRDRRVSRAEHLAYMIELDQRRLLFISGHRWLLSA